MIVLLQWWLEEKIMPDIIPKDRIEAKIFEFRGKKIMLDRDLASLYRVETRVLNQAVRRNIERFPEDFMFQLSKEELENWRSQIVMSNSEKMGMRRQPYAFTEHGILMLSNVLKSNRAIKVSIQIVRVFNKMREMIKDYKELLQKVQRIERRQNVEMKEVWKAIRMLQQKSLK